MTALSFQPVPTLAQRRALAADHAKRYADIQALKRAESAARDACCDLTVPRPGEDGEPQVWAWVGSVPSILIIAAACVAWVAYFWSNV